MKPTVKIRTLRTAAILVLACISLLLSRCISAEEKDVVKYDPVKDEFQMLMVLTDIKVKEADDLAYLEAIYRNRDHLIAPVIPGGANLFPMLGFSAIRAADTQFSNINIFAQRPSTIEITNTETSLKDITITPGTFFIQNNALGYYQAVTVPGKTVDSALAEASKNAADSMAAGIDAELARRAAGGATRTWAELTEQTLKNIVIEAKPRDDAAEPINPLAVIDVESLKKLKQAFADKTLKLTRDKSAILLALPLVATDATEFADLIKQVSKRIDEVIASTKPTLELVDKIAMTKGMQAFLTAATLAPDDKGLTVSVDILKFAQASASLPPHRVDMNEKEKPLAPGEPAPEKIVPPDAVAYLKEKKIPLDDKLTPDQIIQDFNAGSLKPHPSESPVKPGEGIPKPKERPNGMQ